MSGQIMGKTGVDPSRLADLQQLDQLAGELMVTALTLPPGVERRDSIITVGSFHNRIAAIRRSCRH